MKLPIKKWTIEKYNKFKLDDKIALSYYIGPSDNEELPFLLIYYSKTRGKFQIIETNSIEYREPIREITINEIREIINNLFTYGVTKSDSL